MLHGCGRTQQRLFVQQINILRSVVKQELDSFQYDTIKTLYAFAEDSSVTVKALCLADRLKYL